MTTEDTNRIENNKDAEAVVSKLRNLLFRSLVARCDALEKRIEALENNQPTEEQ